MRKTVVLICLLSIVVLAVSFTENEMDDSADNLRKVYSRLPAEWPAPVVDKGVEWQELGILPPAPAGAQNDSLYHLIELGKILFFDPRLSDSGTMSCSSCHQPELSWTDGKQRSIGHEGSVNKRNSPTIQNVWFYKKLFRDGRSNSLEDQAFAPINSETEMHGDIRQLNQKLGKIKGYRQLFDSAFGDPGIDPDRIASALAAFQRTITSNISRFDEFLSGKKNALSNSEIKGLHLFRTKARCINCHYGLLFSDNSFHSNGFATNDAGLYNVTHLDADSGKFKTASLRDVALTGPWMHNGSVNDLFTIITDYSDGQGTKKKDPLIRKLNLTRSEKLDLLAFLNAISAAPRAFTKPELPGMNN